MDIVIIGLGTTSHAVANVLEHIHDFNLAGFFGTREEVRKRKSGTLIHGIAPLLGDHSLLPELKGRGILGFIAAIGDNSIREAVYYEGCQAGLLPVNMISPHAVVNHSVRLGNGIFISPGCILSPGVTIGNNTLCDPGVIIDVNATVGENCYIYPGAVLCVGCKIEKNVTIGARAVINPNITVGKNQNIPAGQGVSESLPRLFRKDAK